MKTSSTFGCHDTDNKKKIEMKYDIPVMNVISHITNDTCDEYYYEIISYHCQLSFVTGFVESLIIAVF